MLSDACKSATYPSSIIIPRMSNGGAGHPEVLDKGEDPQAIIFRLNKFKRLDKFHHTMEYMLKLAIPYIKLPKCRFT